MDSPVLNDDWIVDSPSPPPDLPIVIIAFILFLAMHKAATCICMKCSR